MVELAKWVKENVLGIPKKEEITARVKQIIDSNAFIAVNKAGTARPIILANVNTPKKGQKGHKTAIKHLKDLVANKEITIKPVGKSHGRIVGDVLIGKKSVNKMMKR